MAFYPKAQLALVNQEFDPVDGLRAATAKAQATPWDNIADFATHRSFCGVPLYPRQITLLRLIFLETETMTAYDLDVIEEWRSGFTRRRDVFGVQPDIWERIAYLKARGARRFPHVQFVGGRRGSKGLNGGILGCEQVAYFFSLDDWQAHYGVDAGKDGYINVGATSQTQAKQHQFADIRSMIERCKYLQPHIAETKDYTISVRTPADIRQIAELKTAGVAIEHPIATLRVQALSASSTSFRGAAAFGLFFDEFAHMIFGTGSVKSGDEIYEDAVPSLDQFDLDGLTYIPSSPYMKAGKAYSLYQEGSVQMSSHADSEGIGERARHELAALSVARGEAAEVNANPTMLIVQLPSWGLYTDWERSKELVGIFKKRPIQPGPEHESQVRRKIRNPQKFMVERCVDPGTRILCADFTWRCIDDLQVGDEIIGLDENPPHDGCKQRKMRTAVVKAKFDSYQIAYRLTLDDGTSVVCSADHRWLSTSGTTTESARWRKLSPGRTGPRTVLKVGDHLRWLVDPWEIDESKEAGYLAGLMDGEGTMHEGGGRGGWSLTWSQLPGEVADEALRILKEKGFEAVLRRDSDPLAGQWHEKYLRTRSAGRSWAVQGFAETMRFVGSIGGVKMRRQATGMWEGKGLPKPRKYGRSYKEIVSIEELPPQRLVDIETSTATFIAEGLVSHNCAQWAEVEGAYLDSGVVDRLFDSPQWLGTLEAQGRGYLYRRYRIHCDPGKCLVGDTHIQTAQGLVKITQVKPGEEVATRDGTDQVVAFVPNGVRPVFKVTLERGWQIRATANHPMWTERGWVRIEELLPADKVQVRVGTKMWPSEHVVVHPVSIPRRSNARCCPTLPSVVDESIGRLLGYVTAEGSLRENHLAVSCHVDESIADECADIIRSKFGIEPSWQTVKGKTRTVAWSNRHLVAVLDELGAEINAHSSQKSVPWCVLQSPKVVVAEFLAAYFSGDGTVDAPYAKNRGVTVASASEELIRQVQILLGNFGIHSAQYGYWAKVREGVRKQYWKLTLRGNNLVRFRDEIGFVATFAGKCSRLNYLAGLPHNKPEPDSVFLPVRSIKLDGEEETYDLAMASEEHNFLANGVVTHNTGANFALCVGHLENTPCEVCGRVIPYGEDTRHVCLDPASQSSAFIRPHAVIDLLKVWKSEDFPPDPETGVPTINYMAVQRDIEAILAAFPSTTKISFDQWNSLGAIHALRERFSPGIRVTELTFTERENFVRCEKVKSALNLGWVTSYRDTFYEDGGSLLEMELRFLQDRNGRIIKQDIGPVTTKDLFDAFSVVVADLLHDALERFGTAGGLSLSAGSSNVAALKSGREAERVPMNEARRKLSTIYGVRREPYVPSRNSSIKARERPRPRPERNPIFKGRR